MEEMRDSIRYSSEMYQKIAARLFERSDFRVLASKNNDFVKKLMDEFLSGLGKTDIGGQLSYCEQHISRAEKVLAAAEAKRDKCARLYAVLGVCAGVGVSVLLI